MAKRYLAWARTQIDLAQNAIGPRSQAEHIALASGYFQQAEKALIAVKRRLKPPEV
jgi:hypothetical protein